MKKVEREYIIDRFIGGALLVLMVAFFSCTGEYPQISDTQGNGESNYNSARIVVCGGKGDMVAQTRYVGPDDETSGPQIDGTCYADRLEIYPFFISDGYTIGWPDANQYRYQTEGTPRVTVPSPIPLEILGRNCYAEAQIDINKDHNYIYLYNTALAYTETDKTKFTSTIDTRTNSMITINGSGVSYSTPELYYGILRLIEGSYSPAASAVSLWEINDDNADEIYWYHFSRNEGSAALEGRIFRIVSQVNLTITDIPTQNIDRIDLFADNYPLQITLNGSHGSFYPVSAVTSQDQTSALDSVLLASADILEPDSCITLSSFLLPSEIGIHLWITVAYKSGEVRTFDLRPQTSYYLTGNDAAVYSVGNDLKRGSDLYVYDGNGGKFCFYSYANVRVNMNGRFDNIAVDTGTPDITIEVNPNFEDLHKFEIK